MNIDTGHLERANAVLDDICQALSALNCPYFQGNGTCISGCRDSPQCWEDGVPPMTLTHLIAELTDALQDAGAIDRPTNAPQA